jgi:2-polyprenyl-3-methyl-5-hydroxy-6-metoxy-1,4-benzoquinol methylase
MSTVEMPTIKPTLKKIILDALKLRYTSVSGIGIKTGNHYQSVTFGDEHTAGFRSGREAFLDRIEFQGKRVLDLGSNLGEISRAASARGAALTDGYEYDSFFVELAQLLNAYNGTSRVSFYERDITDPNTYHEHYDIVLALSVYIYLQDVLSAVAAITDGVLVLETHRLDRNLESTYLGPIGRYFPHHVFLGASDWGSGLDTEGERAVIVFAKTDKALRSQVRGLGTPGSQFTTSRRAGTDADMRAIDVRRTPWYDVFFDKFRFNSPRQLLAAVEEMDVEVEALACEPDFSVNGMGGWVYWLIYVKGALQRARGGAIGPGNVYYDLLARHGNNDPGRVADYRDPSRLLTVVHRRFQDFDLFNTHPEAPLQAAPPRLVVAEGPPSPRRGVKRIYKIGSEVPVETTTIDGYHRLFLARLFGHTQIPGDFVTERDAVPDPNA